MTYIVETDSQMRGVERSVPCREVLQQGHEVTPVEAAVGTATDEV